MTCCNENNRDGLKNQKPHKIVLQENKGAQFLMVKGLKLALRAMGSGGHLQDFLMESTMKS